MQSTRSAFGFLGVHERVPQNMTVTIAPAYDLNIGLRIECSSVVTENSRSADTINATVRGVNKVVTIQGGHIP